LHPSLVQKQTSPLVFAARNPGYDLSLTFSHLVSDELAQLRTTPLIVIAVVPRAAQQSSMLPLLTVGPEFTRPACRVAAAAVIDRYQLRAPKQGRVQGGLGRAKPSQPLKLAPPIKHDGRSSATYKLPQKIFACWRVSHSRAGAAISTTLALLNSASTNFINYLLKVKVRTK